MEAILQHPFILKEAAIVEQLRRSDKIELHPRLVNAPLIYDSVGGSILADLYQSYIDVAQAAKMPFLMCTPTWRTNAERVAANNANPDINGDAIRFMQTIRDKQSHGQELIKIGGLIGCKNDCYLPEEGLSIEEARSFHQWQLRKLAEAGADFLIAESLPNIEEAKGIALAMESLKIPYIISFVINRNGHILDGTSLDEAIQQIDDITSRKPLGYNINCAYPTFLCADQQPAKVFDRLIGFQGNGSSLDHCDLDGADELHVESVDEWAQAMLELHNRYGMKVMGGCCGTGVGHLREMVAGII